MSDVRQLGAVLDACGGGPAALFGCSCAGLAMASFARDFPERVSKLVFFGGYAARDDIPDATRGSIIDFVRVNWTLASQMLAGLLVPHASAIEIAAFSRYMRLAADADMAASSLEDDLTTDARAVLPHVTTPPWFSTAAATVPCRSAGDASLRPCCRTPPSLP